MPPEIDMNDRNVIAPPPRITSRRSLLKTVAGTLAAATPLLASAQAMHEVPPNAAHAKLTALHLEQDVPASPAHIYAALLDSRQFAAFSGLPADIDPKAGGAFSMFGGMIVGRNVELVPSQRIVQAWRPTHWDPGIFSIVKFDLKAVGSGTTIVLDHTGFPEGEFDSLSSGWHSHYLDNLKKLT